MHEKIEIVGKQNSLEKSGRLEMPRLEASDDHPDGNKMTTSASDLKRETKTFVAFQDKLDASFEGQRGSSN